MANIDLRIMGMSCQGCAQSVERRLLSTPGVERATVDLANATASVTYDEQITTPYSLEQAIQALGFDVVYNTSERHSA